MKKDYLALLISLFALFLVVGQAHAFNISVSEATPFELDFDNWEDLTEPATLIDPSTGTYTNNDGDGTVDNWGVFQINDITHAVTNAPMWDSGDDREYLIGIFYGIDYQSLTVDAAGNVNLQSVGGTFEAYLLNATEIAAFQATLIDGVDDYYDTDSIAYNEYHTITDIGAEKILSFDLVAGIDPTTDATIDGDADSTTTPLTGDAAWYGSVTGGTYAWLFDTDGYDVTYTDNGGNVIKTTADLLGNSDFHPATSGDFTYESQDPIEGLLASAIPEPNTFILFGLSLLGLAGIGRKKLIG